MTLEDIKRDLADLAGPVRPDQDLEVIKVRVAALHALADILLREQGK